MISAVEKFLNAIDSISDDKTYRWALEEMSYDVNEVYSQAFQELRAALEKAKKELNNTNAQSGTSFQWDENSGAFFQWAKKSSVFYPPKSIRNNID